MCSNQAFAQEQIEVAVQWTTDSPESLQSAADPQMVQAKLREALPDVYLAAGLPENLNAGVTIEGTIRSLTASRLPLTTSLQQTTQIGTVPPQTTQFNSNQPQTTQFNTNQPQTTPPPVPVKPGTTQEVAAAADNSPVIIASLVVGVVGLVGLVAWALLRKKPSADKEVFGGAPTIPVKIVRPALLHPDYEEAIPVVHDEGDPYPPGAQNKKKVVRIVIRKTAT